MNSDQGYGVPPPPEAVEHRPSGSPIPYGPDLGWAKWGNKGPSAAYVEVDDVLLWETWSTVAAIAVNLSVRLLRADGVIVPFLAQIVSTGSTTAAVTKLVTLPAGFILSATVNSPAATHGQLFTRLSVQRGVGSADVTRGDVLISGAPSQFTTLAYPESPATPALSGFGLITYQPVTAPGAGADWTFTVQAGLTAIVRGVRAQLATSATAATRLARVQITDGTHIACEVAAGATQAASLTNLYNWAPGVTVNALGTAPVIINAGFPRECRLSAGFIIQSATQNIQAADQWSVIVLEVEYWFAN